MKNNASLRLAKAALACALFGTMFTSCSKEEEISPLSGAPVRTDLSRKPATDRNERVKGTILDDRSGHLQSLNSEQGRVLLSSSDQLSDGDRLIVKCTDTKCAIIKVSSNVPDAALDGNDGYTQTLHNEVSRSIAGANQITDGDRFLYKCTKEKCDLIKLPAYTGGEDAEFGTGPRHLQSLHDFAK